MHISQEWSFMRKKFERAALLGLIGAILMTGCTPGQKTPAASGDNDTDRSFSETSKAGNKDMVRPELTEEEILNMSDESFTEYGLLLIDHRLEDVQTPNPQRTEFGFTRDEGYRYAGLPAERSASDYEEARIIAREKWQNNKDNKYKDISLLGENDKFWLLACPSYYRGEFNLICTIAVYKKD